MSAADIMKHAHQASVIALYTELYTELCVSQEEFLNMMAGRLRDSDVRGEVEDAFTAFDKDSNGAIGVEDLRAAAAEVGHTGPGLEATVNSTTWLTYSHLWCFCWASRYAVGGGHCHTGLGGDGGRSRLGEQGRDHV